MFDLIVGAPEGQCFLLQQIAREGGNAGTSSTQKSAVIFLVESEKVPEPERGMCKNCMAWDMAAAVKLNSGGNRADGMFLGACRRRGPQAVPDGLLETTKQGDSHGRAKIVSGAYWPVCKENDWCLDFVPKPKKSGGRNADR